MLWRIVVCLIPLLLFFSSVGSGEDTALRNDKKAADKIIASSPTVKVGSRTYVILDGDIRVRPTQASEEVLRRIQAANTANADTAAANPDENELLVMYDEATGIAIWPKGHRRLTYAVDRHSFRTSTEYLETSDAIEEAAKNWQDICPKCGISFEHIKALDDNPLPDDLIFVVRYVGKAPYVASSFFPNSAPEDRVVAIGEQFFTSRFSKAGVLRHELGHVLGYRHEHTRGIMHCAYEDHDWKEVTTYDPRSVMHYLCGGGGTRELNFSPFDIIGHRKVYENN